MHRTLAWCVLSLITTFPKVDPNLRQSHRSRPAAVDAAKPAIQPGDTVVVTNDGAKVMAGDEVIAVLRAGSLVKVTNVKGKWVAVLVAVNGADKIGWLTQTS